MQHKTLLKLYRTALLLVPLFTFCGLSAQNLNFDFERCNVGDKVAETLGEPWTTWNLSPGSAEDAVISDEHCLGTRALKIDNGNDLVLKLGDKTTGAYNIALDMYIPEGKEGYFNILHVFDGGNSVWAQEIFLNSEQHGNYFAPGGAYDDFDVPYNEWFHIDIDIYLDNAAACLKLNDKLIIVWDYTQYATMKYCSIAAMDFFPSNNNANKNGFFIDNVTFTELEGPFVSNLVPEDETIEIVMFKDEQKNVTSSITNEGNVICGYIAPWIDYGVGQDGGTPQELHYDTEPWWIFGYNNEPYIEIGVVFPEELLADSSLVGTKITKMQYFVPFDDSFWVADNPLRFTIYKRLASSTTGVHDLVLAEKELASYTLGEWNTVEFDTPIPITGFDVFATVGFQQIGEGYPISLDAGPILPFTADLVRLNGDSWFSLNDSYTYYNGGEGWGNHNIRLVCEGLPVETQWVNGVYSDSYLATVFAPGQTNNIELAMNSTGLEYGNYTATYRMESVRDSDPEIAIPIHLKVSGTDVNELAESKSRIYPNPASDLVYIEDENMCYVVIFNALGEQVGVKKIESNSIDVNNLANGVYHFCVIDSKGEKTVHRLVISK